MKTSISSEQRNIFVRKFQRLLVREFAIDGKVLCNIMQVYRNDATFWFSMRYFQVNAPFSV